MRAFMGEVIYGIGILINYNYKKMCEKMHIFDIIISVYI